MTSKTKIDADLCIIGAGSGGLSVAAGAAQLGRKVVLIEKGEMGGDCLNTGCVPSKALIAASKHAHKMLLGERFGIKAVEPQIDFGAVIDHVQDVIATIAPVDSQERFEGFGCNVIREHGEFTGEREVTAGDNVITAKHFVVSTGSTAFVPPIDGLEDVDYFTNETIFENRELPEHLIVIGGGPIGLEMAQSFRRLGSQVSVVEGLTISNRDDPDLVEFVRQQLISDGLALHENASVSKIGKDGNNIVVTAGDHKIVGSHLLVAVGRKPTINGLNLEAAGVEYSNKGIKVDQHLRTTNKRVYAIGDVAGGRQFTHVAGYHAGLLVRTILFKSKAVNNEHLAPAVTYTDPELAQVGLNEQAAREQFSDVNVRKWELDENDRAQAERDTRGMIKVMTRKNGLIIGASIVGYGAGDLIQPFAYAIANKQKIRSFTNMISPYPTRGEIAKRVAGAFYTDTLFSDRTRKLVSLLATFD